MTEKYVKRNRCANKHCRIELKDSERGYFCAVCEDIQCKITQTQLKRKETHYGHEVADWALLPY